MRIVELLFEDVYICSSVKGILPGMILKHLSWSQAALAQTVFPTSSAIQKGVGRQVRFQRAEQRGCREIGPHVNCCNRRRYNPLKHVTNRQSTRSEARDIVHRTLKLAAKNFSPARGGIDLRSAFRLIVVCKAQAHPRCGKRR